MDRPIWRRPVSHRHDYSSAAETKWGRGRVLTFPVPILTQKDENLTIGLVEFLYQTTTQRTIGFTGIDQVPHPGVMHALFLRNTGFSILKSILSERLTMAMVYNVGRALWDLHGDLFADHFRLQQRSKNKNRGVFGQPS